MRWVLRRNGIFVVAVVVVVRLRLFRLRRDRLWWLLVFALRHRIKPG